MRYLFAALVLAAALCGTAAQAEKRTFIVANNSDGYGVDRCLASGASCGAAVATAYCKSRDFAEAAFTHADLDWTEHVRLDDRYLRPTEVDALIGDASKAERVVGWRASVKAPELARIMVDADIAELECAGSPRIDTPVLLAWS